VERERLGPIRLSADLVSNPQLADAITKQIEASLGLEPEAYPVWLGEDDLADFGAYREHPEF